MNNASKALASQALGVLTAFETSKLEKAAREEGAADFVKKHVAALENDGTTSQQLFQGLLLVACELLHEVPGGPEETLKRLGPRFL